MRKLLNGFKTIYMGKTERLSQIFKALGEETRLEIVKLLAQNEEVGCTRINHTFKLTRPALSHHYRILKESGLVLKRKEGQYFYLSLNRAMLEKYLPGFLEQINHT